MMRKTLLSVGLCLSLLVACRGKDTPTTNLTPTSAAEVRTSVTPTVTDQTASTATTILRFAVYSGEQDAYDDLIRVFEEDNPSVQIEIVSMEDILAGSQGMEDANLRLLSSADVLPSSRITLDAVRQGLVLDLQPLMTADNTFNDDDLYPNLLEQFRLGNIIWAVPYKADVTLIFFNKDSFDQAELDYPQIGWTWDNFLEAAQVLTIREAGEVTQWGFIEPVSITFQFIQARTGPLFDFSTHPPTPRFNSPEVINGVRWYTDLFLVHEVSPYLPMSEPDEQGQVSLPGYDLIGGGRAAMWLEGSGSWQWRKNQMNVGVVPFPTDLPGGKTSPVSPYGYVISAGTQYPEEAWRWINFLTQYNLENTFGGPTAIPAHRSIAESSGFWNQMDPELGTALRYAIDHTFQPAYQTVGSSVFSAGVVAVLESKKNVAEAMADAQNGALQTIANIEAKLTETTPIPDFVVVEPGEEERGENSVALTFSVVGVADLEPYRVLARQFQDVTPQIIVEVIHPGFTANFKDVAAGADCFQWFSTFNGAENLEAILSLQPFLDADLSINEETFFPAALEAFTYQGQLWGIPADVAVNVIEFNKELFDAAGIKYPDFNWTTDDFVETAITLTQKEGQIQRYGFVSDSLEINDLLHFVALWGVDLINDDNQPATMNFTDLSTVAAMRWYTSLALEYKIKPILTTQPGNINVNIVEEQQSFIDNGRAAMWTSAGRMGEFNRENLMINVGVVPLPIGPRGDRSSGYQSARGFFISANTSARQACWQWITFLSQQSSIVYGLPARRDVADSNVYRQKVGVERAAAYWASIEETTQPTFFQSLSNDNAWLRVSSLWLATAYDQILHEGKDIEEALAMAQNNFDAYRICVMEMDAFNDYEAQNRCALEVDPSLATVLGGG